MAEQIDSEVDFENRLPDEIPVVNAFSNYRDMFRVSLIANLVLVVLICISITVGFFLNAKTDDPYGNGIKTEIRAIDGRGATHELNLHPQDPKFNRQ